MPKTYIMKLTEKDLLDIGFDKKLMVGTGFNSIISMTPAIYYYRKNRITINATTHWTWFLDGEQRNDIAVESRKKLLKLLNKYN